MSDDTLRMLRDSAADFAKLDPARVRGLRTARPGFDRDLWQQTGELNRGWTVAKSLLGFERIHIGSNEIQRNILARQVLNLPS